jgi:hypothetical protein
MAAGVNSRHDQNTKTGTDVDWKGEPAQAGAAHLAGNHTDTASAATLTERCSATACHLEHSAAANPANPIIQFATFVSSA